MPLRDLCLCTILCWCLFPGACQSQPRKAGSFSALKADLEARPSRAAYDSLHFLLARHYTDLTAKERKTLRNTLEKYAIWPFETLCPATEPGPKITIKGRITNEQGQPVRGAKLHIFHADQQGYYAPSDAITGGMMEQDPRLEGYLTTDSSGAYQFHSVRPASYPKQYEGRSIPAHVHIIVHADGFQDHAVQMVFEDDPAMIEYWVDWSKESHYPIVRLTYKQMEGYGEADLALTRL